MIRSIYSNFCEYRHHLGYALLAVVLLAGLSACSDGNGEGKKYSDTHDKGAIKLVVDETLRPFVEAEIMSYEEQYPETQLNAEYVPEREAFKQYMNDDDTVRLIVAARDLRAQERQHFEPKNFMPRSHDIALDAVAFVVNKENIDQDLTMEEVKDILSGKVTNWKELNEKGALDEEIVVVFDNANSSTRRMLSDSLMAPDTMALSRLTAAGNTPKVIEYVANNKNAIGVVGYNWISDKSNPDIAQAYEKVIMVGLPSTQNVQEFVYLPDYPIAYLRDNIYPLRRSVYIHLREPHRGLGTGFVNYVGGQQGLRIILKSGLYPMGRLARKVQFEEVPASEIPE